MSSNEYYREYYRTHKEQRLANTRRWREKYPERNKASYANWYRNHREEKNRQTREYYEKTYPRKNEDENQRIDRRVRLEKKYGNKFPQN